MGKGASPEQAEASALMELIERYSFFSFFRNKENFKICSWSDARKKYKNLIPESEILKSVQEDISLNKAKEILDLVLWKFCKAYSLAHEKTYLIPINWFKTLNEYNGSSAGNTFEESILQGACELVERHVCAIIDKRKLIVPTISKDSIKDITLKNLIKCFSNNNIKLWLKDFSFNMGIPTVGALAFDPSTFPQKSEIVFTAGTATSPTKAAIRAITEVAQLAGDFNSSNRYEPSGLRKISSFQETKWIREGKEISIFDLPDISDDDIYTELMNLTNELAKREYFLYSINITNPKLSVPANYNFIPGFFFRERSQFPSLGLFVGKILVEETDIEYAQKGINVLEDIYGNCYFIPFLKLLL